MLSILKRTRYLWNVFATKFPIFDWKSRQYHLRTACLRCSEIFRLGKANCIIRDLYDLLIICVWGRQVALLFQPCSQPHGSSRIMVGAACVVHVSGRGRLGLEGGSCRRRFRRISHGTGLGLRYWTQEWALCCRHLTHFRNLATQTFTSGISSLYFNTAVTHRSRENHREPE